LVEALRTEVASLQGGGGVEEATFLLRGDERPLPADVEAALFRIAQEGISNVRKHAQARRVREILTFAERSITLLLEDDGVGFDSQTHTATLDGGIGMASMRQRASLIGAELEIDSSPGWGTRIRVLVPETALLGPTPNGRGPIRVLLVDDHPMVREGLRRMLEAMAGIVLIGEAETGEQAIARSRELGPQVVLLDVHLPDMDGVEATRRIHADAPEVHVLMISTTSPDDVVLESVRADARGYLLKDITADELREAIQTAADGGSYFSAPVAAKLAGGVRRGGPAIERLTTRELAVLRHLAEGASNKEIATRLAISENTVQSHLRHIYGKLDVRSRTEALRRASEWGMLEF
jgi:DNA-binding NarL/FixJ family response regulator